MKFIISVFIFVSSHFVCCSQNLIDTTFYKNGNIKSIGYFNNDTLIEKLYHQNGQLSIYEKSIYKNLSQNSYVDYAIVLKHKNLFRTIDKYCENGKLITSWKQGNNGKYIEYYCNGNIRLEADSSYFLGIPSGYSKWYYKDGTLNIEGLCTQKLKDGSTTPACIEQGVWKYYKPDGTLEKKVDFGFVNE